METNRIAGSAKDFAGKLEGAVGDIAGDAKTEAAGRVREATGTAQNLYGQAKDQRAKRQMPPSATPKTLMRTAAILSVTARKRLRRRCETIRSVRC
jgi:uncharacterized protein YjbJ (UPF0337 family)